MLWPVLVLTIRCVRSILSTVPRSLTGGLAGACAAAAADTAAISNAAVMRSMGSPSGRPTTGKVDVREPYTIYTSREFRNDTHLALLPVQGAAIAHSADSSAGATCGRRCC